MPQSPSVLVRVSQSWRQGPGGASTRQAHVFVLQETAARLHTSVNGLSQVHRAFISNITVCSSQWGAACTDGIPEYSVTPPPLNGRYDMLMQYSMYYASHIAVSNGEVPAQLTPAY